MVITDGADHVSHTCSGALISPNLVLTAQHCIAHTSKFVSCERSLFGPPVAPERVFVTFDESMWGEGTTWIPVTRVLTIPGDSSVCGRDVALLRLDHVVAGEATPLTPRIEEDAEEGEVYSAVGYGASADEAGDAGHRRRRDELSIVCVGESCGSSSQVEEPEWRGDHGICNGDSGGPALDGEGRVIGVTSRGPTGCDSPIYGGLTAFRDWLRGEAVGAARAGAYPAPSWATAGRGHGEHGEGAGSCALAAGRPPLGAPGAGLGVLGVLGALALRRRRA